MPRLEGCCDKSSKSDGLFSTILRVTFTRFLKAKPGRLCSISNQRETARKPPGFSGNRKKCQPGSKGVSPKKRVKALLQGSCPLFFPKLKENGQIGLLDHPFGADGLGTTIAPPLPKKP
jgi:hypothetical protein